MVLLKSVDGNENLKCTNSCLKMAHISQERRQRTSQTGTLGVADDISEIWGLLCGTLQIVLLID